ncbi:MAG: hypothetical protein PVS2B2_13570 [Candidatus Acidiferrum sp.]
MSSVTQVNPAMIKINDITNLERSRRWGNEVSMGPGVARVRLANALKNLKLGDRARIWPFGKEL